MLSIKSIIIQIVLTNMYFTGVQKTDQWETGEYLFARLPGGEFHHIGKTLDEFHCELSTNNRRRITKKIINAIKKNQFELFQKSLTVEKLNYTKNFKSIYATKDGQHARNNRGIATGGSGSMVPLLQFSNQTRFTSFSFKHQIYCFLWVSRNYTGLKFQDFYRVCYNNWKIYVGSLYLITTQEKQITSRWIF